MAELLLPRLSSLTPPQQSSPSSDDSYDREIRDLIAFAKHPSRATIIANATEDLLTNLEPSIHSLSYLLVLSSYVQPLRDQNRTRLPEDICPGGCLWNKTVQFLACFDPVQIRYAGYEWRFVVEIIAEAAEQVSKPFLAVPAIAGALLRLDASSEVFTSVHLLVVRLALSSRSYTPVLPILNRPRYNFPTISGQAHERTLRSLLCSDNLSSSDFITDVSGFSAKLTYRDHLEYFVLGAMVYLALKKWDRAIHFLSVVISSPATSPVSKIMVEAYKKRILAGLLAYGRLVGPPKIISSHVLRIYQSLTKPYESLANAFEKGDFGRLASEVELGRSVWHNDNNFGLVSQVVNAFDRGIVMKLRGKFSALPMADIAQQVTTSLEENAGIEPFVASLVMSGKLNATLLHAPDQKAYTMLRLSTVTSDTVSHERLVQARLLEAIRALADVARNANSGNSTLELSDEHLRFLQKSQRWTDDIEKGATASPSVANNSYDVDEDIMGDLH